MKIFVNGCSFTYGADLENINDRYSTFLSDDVVNIGRGGQCNDLIVDRSIEWLENNECDFVIIQFTMNTRFSMWRSGKWISIRPGKALDKITKFYYDKIYTNQLGIRNLWKNVYAIENYLESREIPYLFWKIGRANDTYSQYRKLCKNKDMLMGEDFWDSNNPDMWTYGEHPTPEGHQVIANKLKEYIYK